MFLKWMVQDLNIGIWCTLFIPNPVLLRSAARKRDIQSISWVIIFVHHCTWPLITDTLGLHLFHPAEYISMWISLITFPMALVLHRLFHFGVKNGTWQPQFNWLCFRKTLKLCTLWLTGMFCWIRTFDRVNLLCIGSDALGISPSLFFWTALIFRCVSNKIRADLKESFSVSERFAAQKRVCRIFFYQHEISAFNLTMRGRELPLVCICAQRNCGGGEKMAST